MYSQMYGSNINQNAIFNTANLGETINNEHNQHINQHKGGVYLEGSNFYNNNPTRAITKVAPAVGGVVPFLPIQQHENGMIYECLKPMILIMKAFGIFPIGPVEPTLFKVTPMLMIYSSCVGVLIFACIGYLNYDRVQIIRSAEGKFEEAVIDYLFTVYLFPVVIVPLALYESRKTADVMSDWRKFESVYKRMSDKHLPIFVGNKPLMVTIVLPLIACGTMVINHVTMVHFRIIKIIPYCYINTVTYLIGGIWYLHCDVIGKVATLIANDFEVSLRHIGPSQSVAEYRAMWMLLSKITRNVGMASCYTLTFLTLYLFLIITLTIYGLLSQIQEGFGVKDVGLIITAGLAIALLYFICDEAHYASNCVKVLFQKNLLLVELSWMNEDAQQEIQMFLKATEMNETNISIGGFFDVNRGLFKSLLATMVTYLVVLLQFQISLPEEVSDDDGSMLLFNETMMFR